MLTTVEKTHSKGRTAGLAASGAREESTQEPPRPPGQPLQVTAPIALPSLAAAADDSRRFNRFARWGVRRVWSSALGAGDCGCRGRAGSSTAIFAEDLVEEPRAEAFVEPVSCSPSGSVFRNVDKGVFGSRNRHSGSMPGLPLTSRYSWA